MPARSTGAAVIQPQERGKDFLPGDFRHARPVILDIDPTALLPNLIADGHP